MTRVYLSLGSNMGDRRAYLDAAIQALEALPETNLQKVSSYYETPAWGKTDQSDFLNLTCQLETSLSPLVLLASCQKIEKDLDRVRHEHWGPRTVDIDILLYGEEKWDTETLKVPHPFMTQRAFVLVPLLELQADLTDPETGLVYSDFLDLLDTKAIKRLP